MKKVYIAIAILLLVLGLMYLSCSKGMLSGDSFSSGSGTTVTYFYNPGCPHCRNFMPAWKDFTASGGANFVEINCSSDPAKCSDVRGVPWVVFSKSGSNPVPFTGSRDTKTLQEFLKNY